MAQGLGLAPVVLHGVFGRILHQPARITDLVHHRVAGVGAGTAANAFVLQAIADVDAGRADLHAQVAANAGAQVERGQIGLFRARTAWLAALGVVSDDERVLVKHGTLKARIRAHVLAHQFAHVTGCAKGGQAIKEHPEGLPAAEIARQKIATQLADGREVADKGEAGPQGHGQPQGVFHHLAPQGVKTPRRSIAAQPGRAVAFGEFFQPQKDFGVDRLRAGITAP